MVELALSFENSGLDREIVQCTHLRRCWI